MQRPVPRFDAAFITPLFFTFSDKTIGVARSDGDLIWGCTLLGWNLRKNRKKKKEKLLLETVNLVQISYQILSSILFFHHFLFETLSSLLLEIEYLGCKIAAKAKAIDVVVQEGKMRTRPGSQNQSMSFFEDFERWVRILFFY